MTVRRWVRICSLGELEPGRGAAALVGGRQVAVFRLPPTAGASPGAPRLHAVDNLDPVSGANVLARGLVGSAGDVDYVASPMHKQRFDLVSGRCLDGDHPPLRVWPVRLWGRTVEVLATTEDGPDPPRATTRSTCPFCALQCTLGIRSAARRPGAAPHDGCEVVADGSSPVNRGRLCVKGWASVQLLGAPGRLVAPQVRDRTGTLVSSSWDAALDELASRLSAVAAAHGHDALAVFGSGALTNEAAYQLGKFARVALRTPNIDYNGRWCMASAAAAANRSLGLDRGLPFPLADLAGADTLLLWGANPADTMPPLMQHVDAMRARGGTLVVVDPRRTATAAVADLHVQPDPGSDTALAVGLLHLAAREGFVDLDYLAARTTGWAEVETSLARWDPARVAAVTAVAPAVLERTVQALAAPASVLLTGRGPEQQTDGVDAVTATINLMLALGKPGRPSSGWGCLTGQANGQGGREHGQKADQLRGYRSIADASDRAAVAAIWGVDPAVLPGPGRSAAELLADTGRPGGVRGMLVVGSDLCVAAPDVRRVERRLADLDLLAVLDAFATRTAELADIVLPVAQWAESDGTLTNLEGRVQRRRRAVLPPEGVRSDLEVLAALARRLGHGASFPSSDPKEVFDELRAASAGGRADYSGVTYERLDTGPGVHWPCPATGHLRTPRVFTDRFGHPDGRARMVPVTPSPGRSRRDDDYPVRLLTGRHREAYNSGTQTGRLATLADRRPGPVLLVARALAERLGLGDGDEATVESRWGSVRLPVARTDELRGDVVWAPIHWGGDRAVNAVIGPDTDPVSKMPGFKGCPVRLRPVRQEGGPRLPVTGA